MSKIFLLSNHPSLERFQITGQVKKQVFLLLTRVVECYRLCRLQCPKLLEAKYSAKSNLYKMKTLVLPKLFLNKITILVIVLFSILFPKNIWAQTGDSCTHAISLPTHGGCTDTVTTSFTQ